MAAGTVSVSTLGEPASKLLEDIAKQTGLDLRAAPEVGKDILTCIADKVQPNDLLTRIAAADWAMWRQDGQTWWLERPSTLADNQRRDEERQCRDAIQKELDRQIPSLEALAAEPRPRGLQAAFYLAKVAAYELGGGELSALPIGRHVSYALNAVGGDSELPSDCRPLFAPVLAEAASRDDRASDMGVLISADRLGPEQINIAATIYTSDHASGSATYTLSVPVQQAGGPDRPGNSTQPLSPSDLPVIEPPTQEQAAHPETNDPIAFSWGRYAQAIAKQENAALVAALPDAPFDFSPQFRRVETNTRYLRNALSAQSLVDDSRPGWVVIKARFPSWARSEFIDRGLLGKFIRAGVAKGGATIDELSAFVSAAPPLAVGAMATEWTRAADPVLGWLLQRNPAPDLRFYADLTQDQKDRLRANGTVDLQDLGTDAAKDLRAWANTPWRTHGPMPIRRVQGPEAIEGRFSNSTELQINDPAWSWAPIQDPGSLGRMFVFAGRGLRGPARSAKYRLTSCETLNLFVNTGQERGVMSLLGSWSADGTAWHDLKDLPPDVLAQIDQASKSVVIYNPPRTIHP